MHKAICFSRFSRFSQSFRPNTSILAEKFSLYEYTSEQWMEKINKLNKLSNEKTLPTLISLPSLPIEMQKVVNWNQILPSIDTETKDPLVASSLLYSLANYQDSFQMEFQNLKRNVISSLYKMDDYNYSLALAGLYKVDMHEEELKLIFMHLYENRKSLSAANLLEGLLGIHKMNKFNSFDKDEVSEVIHQIARRQCQLSINDYINFIILSEETDSKHLINSKMAENVFVFEKFIPMTMLANFASYLAKVEKGTTFLWQMIVATTLFKRYSIDEGASVLFSSTVMGQNDENVHFLFKSILEMTNSSINTKTLSVLLLSATQMRLEDQDINNQLKTYAMSNKKFKGPELMILSQHYQVCMPSDNEYRNFVKIISSQDEEYVENVKKLKDSLNSYQNEIS